VSEWDLAISKELIAAAVGVLIGMKKEYLCLQLLIPRNATTRTLTGRTLLNLAFFGSNRLALQHIPTLMMI
jgi:hypothetical protein